MKSIGHDGPKTQTGIETCCQIGKSALLDGHDGPKTQTGIETTRDTLWAEIVDKVTTDRKPRPGLKRGGHCRSCAHLRLVTTDRKPRPGLKPDERRVGPRPPGPSRRTENPDRD